jgi:hypothetical protein
MRKTLACAIGALALVALARGAGATPTPAALCASAVELASSKFAACRLKAEATFSKTANGTKRDADLAKCSIKYVTDFGKAQTRYGASCPMVDSEASFEAYLTQCGASTTAAANGASLPGCGNDAVDAPGEQCDGADLGGASCSSLGFAGGTLGCSASCQFDTSACTQSLCGNGSVDGSEQCDGANLNGASCVSLGYASGSLACSAGCGFDTTGCVARTLPATGQTTCFDSTGGVIACAGTGQDGDTLAGATFAYTDNGDGTITDHNTGLVWEKLDDNNAAGIHDRDDFYTWDDAVAVKIAALDTSPCFAGHCDWRLPNLKELQSIANYEIPYPGPSVWPPFQAGCTPGCTSDVCSCTNSDVYWTSTSYVGSPDFAWYVFFVDGSVLANQKTSGAYVRAVRSGP